MLPTAALLWLLSCAPSGATAQDVADERTEALYELRLGHLE